MVGKKTLCPPYENPPRKAARWFNIRASWSHETRSFACAQIAGQARNDKCVSAHTAGNFNKTDPPYETIKKSN
jgi:hypothetical protein